MTTRETTVTEISLHVAEALSKDVGRGLARVDPADIEHLGVTIGDIVEVRGKRSTAARIMPAFMEQRGKSLVQVDGIVRENAQAGLDETVVLRKLAAPPARAVGLAPLGRVPARTGAGHADYIARLLQGRPLTAGDRVRIDILGTQDQEYQVVET